MGHYAKVADGKVIGIIRAKESSLGWIEIKIEEEQ